MVSYALKNTPITTGMYALYSYIPAPGIITHPTDTSSVAPFNAVFTCSGSAFGHLNIFWYKNDEMYESVSTESSMG